jgi:hypothetical protein
LKKVSPRLAPQAGAEPFFKNFISVSGIKVFEKRVWGKDFFQKVFSPHK